MHLRERSATADWYPLQPLTVSFMPQGSGQRKNGVVYILDVLAVYDEFLGHKPLKERSAGVLLMMLVTSSTCGQQTIVCREIGQGPEQAMPGDASGAEVGYDDTCICEGVG